MKEQGFREKNGRDGIPATPSRRSIPRPLCDGQEGNISFGRHGRRSTMGS
jgi:hypothetical protein